MTHYILTFAVEPYLEALPELVALWQDHWEEVATDKDKVPLDVDLAAYASHDRAGILHLVVARAAGRVIGYHMTLVRTHLHYASTLCGFTDVYFLDAKYRQGDAGIRLFRKVEQTLKARGVKKLYTGTKTHKDLGRLFEALGWTQTETLFTKYIGED